jgi:hypothetical protein
VAVLEALKRKALAVIVCEVKPMRHINVTPFSNSIHTECARREVPGCRTQLGISDLNGDGYHIRESCLPILDKTFACAIIAIHVLCPTTDSERWNARATPEFCSEWPRVGAGMGKERRGMRDGH